MDNYFDCLYQEITEKSLSKQEIQIEVDTIYIGGGTPSIVQVEYIEKILSKIYENFKVSKNAEITIEIKYWTSINK